MTDALHIKETVSRYQGYMTDMRREFHRHPEISGQEHHTREILVREIESMDIPYRLLAGTGLIAIIKGGKPGKHRVLRADMDALPVREDDENLKQKKECVSCVEGVSHACGYDAHMAMLLGTMKALKELQDDIEGTVYCCFEEGEETNCGIGTMMEALKEYPVDACFALHVYNGLDAGKVNVVPGPRMAGTVGIGFHIKGRSGHGSRPDQALNPIIPAAHIITQAGSAFVSRLDVEETVTLGFGMVRAGEATNVIPEDAYVGGTARFFNREVALQVQRAAVKICGEDVLAECGRWYASECYSAYLEKYAGALGFLGIRNEAYGSGAAHHNEKFDIDESVLSLGACTEAAFVFSD